jgi:hypothetical protein
MHRSRYLVVLCVYLETPYSSQEVARGQSEIVLPIDLRDHQRELFR